MTMIDFTLENGAPIRSFSQTARFFRDGSKDKIEIAFVGSKDTLVQAVTPAHMAQFASEWAAYCDGRPPERRKGTALTELSSINEARAEHYISRNIHNLEELAALNDGQCQAIGHGCLTDRKGARDLLSVRHMRNRDRLNREIQEKQASVGSSADPGELDALKSEMAELKQMLVQALAPKKRGRKPKEKAPE